jgi:Protein of unknown function (DUF1588)
LPRRFAREFYPVETGVEDEDDGELQRNIGEEPLSLIAYVAMNDLPFSNILHGNLTFATPLLKALWPLQDVAPPPGWVPPRTTAARYTDGRPSAGVLSMNAIYWRHTSTVDNANRGRTNAISSALMCEDYLSRPIDFPKNIDLTNADAIGTAIRTNAACQACHATLDPMASHLWGFMFTNSDAYTWSHYQLQNETLWRSTTETPPAFFGTPSHTLPELASNIASDERFVRCTVKRVYESLMGRRADLDDEGILAEHREAFLAGGLALRPLVKSVVMHPLYRGANASSTFGGDTPPAKTRIATANALGDSIEHLTGFRFIVDQGWDALHLDTGIRALAGGSDRGFARDASTGMALVHLRLAEGGAQAVARGVGGGVLQPLFPTAQKPSAQTIVDAVRAVRGVQLPVNHEDITGLLRIYDDIQAGGEGDAEALTGLLTALLADPDLLLY